MSPEFALVDANILVYSCYHDSEHHAASHALLERAQDENAGLCVAAQWLTEFYCVVTNPRRVSPPREPNEVLDTIETLLKLPGLTLVPTPADLPARWIRLTRRIAVRGADIFDVQLVATMLANDVTRIYTYNRPAFERFGEVKVLTP